jgi:hypothetical protein
MAKKEHKSEEIMAKLRPVDVLASRCRSVAEAIRAVGITEVACGRAVHWVEAPVLSVIDRLVCTARRLPNCRCKFARRAPNHHG